MDACQILVDAAVRSDWLTTLECFYVDAALRTNWRLPLELFALGLGTALSALVGASMICRVARSGLARLGLQLGGLTLLVVVAGMSGLTCPCIREQGFPSSVFAVVTVCVYLAVMPRTSRRQRFRHGRSGRWYWEAPFAIAGLGLLGCAMVAGLWCSGDHLGASTFFLILEAALIRAISLVILLLLGVAGIHTVWKEGAWGAFLESATEVGLVLVGVFATNWMFLNALVWRVLLGHSSSEPRLIVLFGGLLALVVHVRFFGGRGLHLGVLSVLVMVFSGTHPSHGPMMPFPEPHPAALPFATVGVGALCLSWLVTRWRIAMEWRPPTPIASSHSIIHTNIKHQ